ncbi:hypothetical protein GGX14DRAFT_619058, partial [Mycena pura]
VICALFILNFLLFDSYPSSESNCTTYSTIATTMFNFATCLCTYGHAGKRKETWQTSNTRGLGLGDSLLMGWGWAMEPKEHAAECRTVEVLGFGGAIKYGPWVCLFDDLRPHYAPDGAAAARALVQLIGLDPKTTTTQMDRLCGDVRVGDTEKRFLWHDATHSNSIPHQKKSGSEEISEHLRHIEWRVKLLMMRVDENGLGIRTATTLAVPPMGMALANAVVVAGRQFRQNGDTSSKHHDRAYLANDWYLSSGPLATPAAVALFLQLQNAAGMWLCDDIPAGLSFGCLTGLGWAQNMPRIMVPDWALPAWPTSGHMCSTSAKCPIYGPTLYCQYITVSLTADGVGRVPHPRTQPSCGGRTEEDRPTRMYIACDGVRGGLYVGNECETSVGGTDTGGDKKASSIVNHITNPGLQNALATMA